MVRGRGDRKNGYKPIFESLARAFEFEVAVLAWEQKNESPAGAQHRMAMTNK